MSLGFFSGAAAGSFADSNLDWRRIWGAEKEADRQYDLAQQQMTFSADQAAQTRAFQERLAKAQEAFQLGVLDRNEAFEIGKMSLDRLPEMGLDQQWSTVEWLRESGNPLATVAQNSVRASLFDNFGDAVNLVDSVFTAPIGTRFNPTFVNMAADAVIGRSGMGEAEAEAFRADLTKALEARGGEAEAFAEMQWGGAQAALDLARANVDVAEGQAGVYTAQEAQIWGEIDLDAAMKDDIVKHARLVNEQLSIGNNQQAVILGNLPAQLAAELENLQARTTELDNGAELFNRTIEYVVSQQASATGLAAEELRHNLAVGMFRDAIVKGNATHLMATIDYIDAQEAESRARTEGLHTQNEAAILDMSITRTEMLSQLVEWGRADLLGEVGTQLLEGLGIPEERQGALLESLQATASSRLSNAEKMEKAQVDLAIADAGFATWRTENAPIQQGLDNAARDRQLAQQDRALDLQEEGLDVEWTRVNAYARSFDAPTPGSVSLPADEIHNDIKNALGISVGQINQSVEGYGTWTAADAELSNAVTLDESGVPTEYDRDRLVGVAAQYGIDGVELLSDEQLFRATQGLIRANTTTTRARAEADTLAYIRAWINKTGEPPTAGELGFESGNPIFTAAMERIPGLSLTTAAAGAVEADVQQLAELLSPEIGADGAFMGAAASVYESLVETYGEEAVANAGYGDAATLIDPLNRAAAEYANAEALAQEAIQGLNVLNPNITYDLQDPASRANLEQTIASYERTADTLINMVQELPSAWDRAMGGILARRAATAADQQALSSVLTALQLPRDSLIERGIVSMDGVITDRAALLELLYNYQGNLANQRGAVQLIDGRLRAR